MASLVNSTKHPKRVNTYTSQTLQKNGIGSETFKLAQTYPDTKTRQKKSIKEKVIANIPMT